MRTILQAHKEICALYWDEGCQKAFDSNQDLLNQASDLG